MSSNGRLSGREERRLPIMMEINLAPAGRATAERRERTFTDNISPHGLRVQSASSWQMGEQAEVTPMKGEIAMLGEVVYCQRVRDNRFFLGLKFRDKHIPWIILQRFNGLTHTDILGAMRWSEEDGRQPSEAKSRAGRKRENE
ncbi:MAG TPA: PilZ domain-containing protein [Candidatus Acidoferrum sp.]|nr:PilZ domain-containing protein [Candidatus Acidoferrum sp.]